MGAVVFDGNRNVSGVNAVEGAGERDGFTDVVEAADPGNGALDPHAESAVRDAAVAAEVEIPLKSFAGELVLVDSAA
jgi:hypothetical protein